MSYQTGRFLSILGIVAGFFVWSLPAVGIEIPDVQPVALDQPRINVLLKRTPTGEPLTYWELFNIEAYFDTGASGVLLSKNTAEYLGVVNSRHPEPDGPEVIFEDVGIAGSEEFYVSEPLYVGLAKYHPDADIGNIETYETVYNQSFGPLRTQIGPAFVEPDPLIGDLDIVGVPVMAGKVVVMDPKPVDTFLDTMRTYVYDPGTPYNAAQADSEPGIPVTNRHLRLSNASFERFTQITPEGAPGPTLRDNPFLGPNPVAELDGPTGDTTPGVTIGFDGAESTGSYLLDTGAVASIISEGQAENVHVRYVPGTLGTDDPQLEQFDPAHPGSPGTTVPDQFQLMIGGIGGTATIAGFFLDDMLLRTMEGDPGNDQDPNHLLFNSAPVLVYDITVQDPLTQQTLTLDGIFGSNYLIASALVDFSSGWPDILDLATGNFNWAVYDHTNGILGLDTKAAVPLEFAVWSGDGSGDPNWSNSANWEIAAPNPSDGVRFAQPLVAGTNNFNNFTSGTQFGGIVFSGETAFDLQGNSIDLWGNVINISSQTQTISLDMELGGADRTFNADSGDIVVEGVISGDQGIVKTGNEALTLKAPNTYIGQTNILQGMLVLDGGDLDEDSLISVADGAWFKVLSGTPQVGDIVGQGTTEVSGAGTVLMAKSIFQGALSIGAGARVVMEPIVGGGFGGGGNPVPEPSTLLLLGIGALGLLAYARRRKY